MSSKYYSHVFLLFINKAFGNIKKFEWRVVIKGYIPNAYGLNFKDVE